MRICFLGDFHSIHTFRWARYFAGRNDVHLISLEALTSDKGSIKTEDYERLGIEVHLLQRKGLNKILAPGRVRKLIGAIDPSIIHAHYITHYGYLAAKSGFHPIIMTAWGTDVLIEVNQTIIKGHQIRYALNRTDVVTCDGENTAKALRELMGDDKKIRKIYFGVDTKKLNSERRVPGFYQKYSKSKNGKIVINLRGFAEVYDQETFLKAVPPVLEKYPDTVFIMARESDRRKIFEQLAESLGIADSVKFIGNISADDLPNYLSSADIYVSNSLSDSGISASTAEAMASGIAVISTEVGDISFWIEDGKSGFIIPKSDSKALSDKILYLLENEEIRKSMGREARKTIETRQDYYKEMGKVEQLYESMIKEASK